MQKLKLIFWNVNGLNSVRKQKHVIHWLTKQNSNSNMAPSQTAAMWVNNKIKDNFWVQKGMRQGCPLSPLLFFPSTRRFIDRSSKT